MATSQKQYLDTASLAGLHWLAIVLALLTGVLHVYAGLDGGVRIPLILAGLGFFGGTVLFLMNYRRRLLYPVAIIYTGIQIPAWYVVNAGQYTTVGYVDKAVQILLVAVLAYLYVTGDGKST